MFKLTKKSEYALIALRYLQINHSRLCSTKKISQVNMIPKQVLAKVLQKMAKLNYLEAYQGINGGYRLKKSFNKIYFTEFIEKMEGPFGLVNCNVNDMCDQIANCNIKIPLNKLNGNIKSFLNKVKVVDIIN